MAGTRRKRQHDANDSLAMVPWYWRDWRASRARAVLKGAARDAYRELLDAHYGEPTCSLSDDDADLAALAGYSLEEWMAMRDQVLRFLPRMSNGRRRHPRTYFEWKKSRAARQENRQRATDAANKRWAKEKAPSVEHARSNAGAVLEECPPSPSPSPTPLLLRTNQSQGDGPGPRPNPFVQAGGRPKLEAEALALTAEIAELLGEDGAEVFRQAAGYEGARTAKTNPADLTDNRLLNTVLDLRAMLKGAKDTAADKERRGENVRR